MDGGQWNPDDSELVRQARSGQGDAFHLLVDRHARFLLAMANSLAGPADAEDLVQETFAGAFRGLDGFKGQSSFKTWLARILVRQAARHRQVNRRRNEQLQQRFLTSSEHVFPESHAADVRMDVSRAILALSPEHREVVVLRELQGFSYEQIAEILELPRGTVESRLFRARQALQELLKEYL